MTGVEVLLALSTKMDALRVPRHVKGAVLVQYCETSLPPMFPLLNFRTILSTRLSLLMLRCHGIVMAQRVCPKKRIAERDCAVQSLSAMAMIADGELDYLPVVTPAALD